MLDFPLQHPRLKPIQIGSVTIEHPVILAPMSGVTDMPFRRLVKKHGASLVVSEMIASQAMVRECRKTMQMIQRSASGDGVKIEPDAEQAISAVLGCARFPIRD